MINNKNVKKGIIVIGIIAILIFVILKINRSYQIDSCLDKGGKWNYDLKKCECFYTIDTNRIADYYWISDFDTITNQEYLKRGKMLDSISKSPNEDRKSVV